MKKFIYFLLTLSFFSANAQKGYSINYDRTLLGYGNVMFQMRYVYNDSFSFCYYKSDYDSNLEKTNVFSKKLIHHALFTDKKSMICYNEVNYDGRKGYFVNIFTILEWKPYAGAKKILGYDCKGALNVSSNNDSTLVWYNDSLGNGIGLMTLNFSLGTPLEIFDQKNDIHFIATKIDKGDYEFNLPKGEILKRE